MDGEPFQKIHIKKPQIINSLPEFSFVPAELLEKGKTVLPGRQSLYATFGAVLGGISLVFWVIMLFGILFSLSGITFSVMGLKSERSRRAWIGLGLSLVGLIASLLYAYMAYLGKVNFNYFTTEFWG